MNAVQQFWRTRRNAQIADMNLNGRVSSVRNAVQREVEEDKEWDNAVEYSRRVLK